MRGCFLERKKQVSDCRGGGLLRTEDEEKKKGAIWIGRGRLVE